MEGMTPTDDIEIVTKESSPSSNSNTQQEEERRCITPQDELGVKSPENLQESEDSRMWIMKETPCPETELDSNPESEMIESRSIRTLKTNIETPGMVLSDESSYELLQEQLAVLRAEKGKLHHETEMLKLKKDKLKLQIDCYTNEIKKQEMEKEKLRLEIKLLQSKVMEDNNDVSHYIFVP